MAIEPANVAVDVTLTINNNFVSRRGFGTPLIVTTASVAGEVDATARTKLYGSIEEVAVDWLTTTSVYKAAVKAFSRNPRPRRLKVGHVVDDGTMTSEELQAQMDLLAAYDNDWYMLTITDELRDVTATVGLLVWAETKRKLAMIDSNAVGHEDPANTTVLAAANKGLYQNSAVFYHDDVDQYPAISAAAYLATSDFDEANQGYTLKFKTMPTIPAVNLSTAEYVAVTGFTGSTSGQTVAAGHLANTIIDIGGQAVLVEGSVLKANTFIDTIHATHWIISRTEEEILNLFLNNRKIFFTPVGMRMIEDTIRAVMQQGVRAGIVDTNLDPLTGKYNPAIEITTPNVYTDITASQRAARVAPAIACRFRYAGSIHFASVNYTLDF